MSKGSNLLPTKEAFSRELEALFRARMDEGPEFDLTLEDVVVGVSNEVQESFSLRFRGPSEAPMVQHIYRLDNKALGSMNIFLVPIKKDESGLYYEAVFNHLVGV